MTLFSLGAALLVLMAVAFVAWPLRGRGHASPAGRDERRETNLAAWSGARAELDAQLAAQRIDAAEHARALLEIDRRLLAESAGEDGNAEAEGGRRTLFACVLALPLAAGVLYAALGAAPAVELDGLLAGLDRIDDPAERSARTLELLPRLEAAARGPDENGGYRFMLAQTCMSLERFAEAASLYEQLVAQFPQDAALIARQAQALYLAGGRTIGPAVQALVDRAFKLDPAQPTLLGMVGMDRFQAGDYPGAIAAWERLLAQLPADSADAPIIRDGIAMARARSGGAAGEAGEAHSGAAATPAPAEEVAASGSASAPAEGAPATPSLRVSVHLADGLSAPPDATVFVFARAVDGPPMPLAVARFRVDELPRVVDLNDAMAMAPGLTLSRFREVSVTARITRSGTVTAQPGDMEGSSGPIQLEAAEQQLSVAIDRAI